MGIKLLLTMARDLSGHQSHTRRVYVRICKSILLRDMVVSYLIEIQNFNGLSLSISVLLWVKHESQVTQQVQDNRGNQFLVKTEIKGFPENDIPTWDIRLYFIETKKKKTKK